MAATVWTPARKWLGNLIPAAVWTAFAAYGLYQIVQTKQLVGQGLIFLIIATVAGWIALNFFGFYQNGRMRRRLTIILGKDGALPADRVFVGFASPKYTGLLDAHEDVGFLCFLPDKLVFIGENRTLEVGKGEIQKVQFRPNVHTMVGLGRWISIEGAKQDVPIRLLIEPRERNTMLGNLRFGPNLRRKIVAWRTDAKAA
ncbi:MAG TPA: hypothetical protein VG944_23915 [Fimbriimonas sp.]|nr:hypothetical protein [Fimbriimonas sp.]